MNYTTHISHILAAKEEQEANIILLALQNDFDAVTKSDWSKFAEWSSSLSNSGAPENKINLVWAEVAIKIYERLADVYKNSSMNHSLLYSANILRAKAIVDYGNSKNAPFDLVHLKEWVKIEDWKTEDVIEKSKIWKSLDTSEIASLKDFKTRLKLLINTLETVNNQLPGDIIAWKKVIQLMP